MATREIEKSFIEESQGHGFLSHVITFSMVNPSLLKFVEYPRFFEPVTYVKSWCNIELITLTLFIQLNGVIQPSTGRVDETASMYELMTLTNTLSPENFNSNR